MILEHYATVRTSEKNKNWYYVKVRKDKNCADGYIQKKFVVKKEGEDKIVKVKTSVEKS